MQNLIFRRHWARKSRGTAVSCRGTATDCRGRLFLPENAQHFSKNAQHFSKNAQHFSENAQHFSKNAQHFSENAQHFPAGRAFSSRACACARLPRAKKSKNNLHLHPYRRKRPVHRLSRGFQKTAGEGITFTHPSPRASGEGWVKDSSWAERARISRKAL